MENSKKTWGLKALIGVLIFFHMAYGGLDRKLDLDETPFWKAHYDLPKIFAISTVGYALYEGSQSRAGLTAWRSMEAGILSQIVTEALKRATGRLRPTQSDSPNEWFSGGKSFPSGHVSGMTALVTPWVLEYQEEYPAVHLLWFFVFHQMGGRLKAQAHWQSDVIVGALVGFASGYVASKQESPFLLRWSKDGVFVGLRYRF